MSKQPQPKDPNLPTRQVFQKEAHVKEAVKQVLKKKGVWYFMPAMNGFGRMGVPDFVCCYKGVFLAIETKYGGNGLTAHQSREIDNIQAAGGSTLVIDEGSVVGLPALLDAIAAMGDR